MRVHCRTGFTLIEVLFAAFIFAVGVLALEAMAASALLRMRRSAQLSLAASVARARLELLASSRCANLSSGTDTVRSIASAWVVDDAVRAGIGTVNQTLRYSVDGAIRTDRYLASFPCAP